MEPQASSAHPDLLTWHPFHVTHWPQSIANTSDYDGGDRLTLSWDLGRVTEKEKKLIIKQWGAKLPELQNIRWLNLWTHVTQAIFDAACQIRNLECLQIKWSNVKSLAAMKGMTSLRYLHIGSSTRVESLTPLASLSGLKLLEIENFKLIDDFSPLLALTGLESLVVSGSMWTRQDVGSLAPYSKMTWLKSLAIDTARVKSLRPLGNLQNLKHLDLGGKLPMQEYAWLAAKLPNTECRWFEPYLDVAGSGFTRCVTCYSDSKVMLTGKGGGLMCRTCDREEIAKHQAAFVSIKERASTE